MEAMADDQHDSVSSDEMKHEILVFAVFGEGSRIVWSTEPRV